LDGLDEYGVVGGKILMRQDEKTLKEIRERCAITPGETVMKIGYRKKLVSGLDWS